MLTKKCLPIIIFVALLSFVLSTIIWQLKINDSNNYLGYKKFEIQNLQDQIAVLRDEKTKLEQSIPPVYPIPYFPKESLAELNVYKLDCFNLNQDPREYLWIPVLKQRIDKKYPNNYVCFNISLDQAAIVSDMNTVGQIPDKYRIQLYGTKDNYLNTLRSADIRDNFIDCNKIVAWTKTGNLYYQCQANQSRITSSDYTIFRLNISSNSLTVREACYGNYSNRQKLSCINYCQSNIDCTKGSICNKESSLCQLTMSGN